MSPLGRASFPDHSDTQLWLKLFGTELLPYRDLCGALRPAEYREMPYLVGFGRILPTDDDLKSGQGGGHPWLTIVLTCCSAVASHNCTVDSAIPRLPGRCPEPLSAQSPILPGLSQGSVLENYIMWHTASRTRAETPFDQFPGIAAPFLPHNSSFERCRIQTNTPLSPKLGGPFTHAASRDWPATSAGHARRDAMGGNRFARPARSRAGRTNAATRTVSCSPQPHCQCCPHHHVDIWLLCNTWLTLLRSLVDINRRLHKLESDRSPASDGPSTGW